MQIPGNSPAPSSNQADTSLILSNKEILEPSLSGYKLLAICPEPRTVSSLIFFFLSYQQISIIDFRLHFRTVGTWLGYIFFLFHINLSVIQYTIARCSDWT